MEIANRIVPGRSIHNQGTSFNDNYRSQRMEKISPQIFLEDQQPLVVAEEEATTQRKTNPLLIAEVLDVIFPCLDHATLKTCRTVSSLWSVLATPLLRSRSQVNLGDPLIDERSDAFLSTISSSATLPMASLTYKLYHTPSTSPLSDRASHFFTQFGHSLTSLTLQAYAFSNSKDYFSIVSHLVGRDCPSLTRLALTHLQHLDYKDPLDPAILNFTSPSIRHFTLSFGSNFFPGPRSVSNCAAVFSSLLAIVPNATSLTTSCPGGGETFLRTLRDYNISAHLTSFSLTSAPLDMGAMNVLNSMNFGKLTSLKINTQFTVQPEFIHFLEKLSPTLEKLVIHGDKWGVMATYGNGFTMDFPLMPELRVFQHESYECLRVAGDDFLQRLPNLGELVIRDFLSSLVDMRRTVYGTMFSPRGEMRPNYANVHVKKVVLGVVFVPSDENLGVMETLLKMFPNVAELEVAVSFAYQNVHVGQVLDTLAKSKIKKLKITFLQCSELISERVAASFRSVLGNYLPKFSELQRVEFILDDMPPMARFNLPLGIVKGILCTKSLSVLNLTGFSLGENLEETEMCRQLVDEKLVQWKLSEGVITRSLISLASNFSNFEYKLVDY